MFVVQPRNGWLFLINVRNGGHIADAHWFTYVFLNKQKKPGSKNLKL